MARLGWLVAAVLTGIVAVFVASQGREPDYAAIHVESLSDLESELEQLRARLDIPGMAAAIADEGRIVWARGFGYANLERKIAVDPDLTSFHLASVTKPYTATVVLQLAEEGRLDLVSQVREFGVETSGDSSVRIWHLLSHTASPPAGTRFRYDARAYGALTQIVERATGRPFSAELTDRIVRKLDLKHTGPNPREIDRDSCRAVIALRLMGMCGNERQPARERAVFEASALDRSSLESGLAMGYARWWGRDVWPAGLFGPMRPEQHLTELFASAGLVASVTDVLRFSIALDQGVLLTASTLLQAYTPAIGTATRMPRFGLGWFVQQFDGTPLVWHFGQAFESSSLLMKLPERRVAFVALANSDGLSRGRRLGDHGDVLESPAARLFLKWYVNGKRR